MYETESKCFRLQYNESQLKGNQTETLVQVNILKFQTLYSILFWPKFCILCNCFLKYFVEWQTVQNLIRLLLNKGAHIVIIHVPCDIYVHVIGIMSEPRVKIRI